MLCERVHAVTENMKGLEHLHGLSQSLKFMSLKLKSRHSRKDLCLLLRSNQSGNHCSTETLRCAFYSLITLSMFVWCRGPAAVFPVWGRRRKSTRRSGAGQISAKYELQSALKRVNKVCSFLFVMSRMQSRRKSRYIILLVLCLTVLLL